MQGPENPEARLHRTGPAARSTATRSVRACRTATGAALLVLSMLSGCASRAPVAPAEHLLQDALYPDALPPPERDQVFTLSPAMKAYADRELAPLARLRDPRQALIDALYRADKLRLGYDAGNTRNAAEAFEARAGNCLSLVIMTAAFARELGLPVSYQAVLIDETYTRSGGLVLGSGHVNLVLSRVVPRATVMAMPANDMTVDFLPAEALRGQRTVPLAESTVIAMYGNNRAAEALSAGQNSLAYAWAREALRHEPGFAAALNTLAVLYMRDGHDAAAEAALRHLLARVPDHDSALSNLALLLQRQGRLPEAEAVRVHLAQVQPAPPFQYYEQGRQAMDRGDLAGARELFERELRRQPEQSEVLFWAAQAHWRLGDQAQALRLLQKALAYSNTPRSRELYAGKLAWLKAYQHP